jgi:hypothetical protein
LEAGPCPGSFNSSAYVDWFYWEFANLPLLLQTQLVIGTHKTVGDIHRKVLTGQEDASGQNNSACAACYPSVNTRLLIISYTQARLVMANTMGSAVLQFNSIFLGESPPPAPRDCFGRGELIGKVVGFTENLKFVALIGAGGIDKISIAFSVQFSTTIGSKIDLATTVDSSALTSFPLPAFIFLALFAEIIGAGIENPKNLRPLRPFLTSKDMLLILDNAESILDPKGPNAKDIYLMVDELYQFNTNTHLRPLALSCVR